MANPEVTIDLLLQDASFRKKVQENLKNFTSVLQKMSNAGSRAGVFSGVMQAASRLGNIITGLKSSIDLITNFGKSITRIIMKIGELGFSMAEAADNAERSAWKFNIVFEGIEKSATNAAERIASSYGRHISTIQESMARIGDVLRPVGVPEEMMVQMSAAIAELAQNSKEWTIGQYDARTASIALTKALVGEREMMKEMGIIIREADITDYLKQVGWAYNEANKMAATYNLMLEKTAETMQKAAGTRMTSYAEKLIQFWEAVKGTMVDIGQILQPIAKALITLGQTFIDKIGQIIGSKGMGGIAAGASKVADQILRLADAIAKISVQDWLSDLRSMISVIMEFLGSALKAVVLGLAPYIVELGKLLADSFVKGAAGFLGVEYERRFERMGRFGDKGLTADFRAVLAGETVKGSDLASIMEKFTRQMEAIVQGRLGRRSEIGRTPPYRALPVGEADPRMAIGVWKRERDKLVQKLESIDNKLEGVGERATELRTRRQEMMQQRDELQSGISGISEVWSQMVSEAASKKGPNYQIERNTRELKRIEEDRKKLDGQRNDYLKKLVEHDRTPRYGR